MSKFLVDISDDNYNLNMLLIKRIILRRLNRTPHLLT